MRRRTRRAEPRIVDPATHQRTDVCLAVAAAFLEMDRRALNHYIAAGCVRAPWRGRRRRVAVVDLVALKSRLESGQGICHVPRETAEPAIATTTHE